MLPYKSGDEILKEMWQFSETPVIVISAKDMVGTKIDLLKLGADVSIVRLLAQQMGGSAGAQVQNGLLDIQVRLPLFKNK